MNDIYPDGLIARPHHNALRFSELRLGDTVYLQSRCGAVIKATVTFVGHVMGRLTYTAEQISLIGARLRQDLKLQRIRFRLQDVHQVERVLHG